MNAETFAEWMRRQGYRVIRTESSFWYTAGPRVLQAFPYHWQISPSEGEIQELMREHAVLALRYSTPLCSFEGRISYHIVLCKPYDLGYLKTQTRNSIKRGLHCFDIEQISFKRLATEGWILQQDTLERQGRLRCMEQKKWERICYSADGLPGFEAWAAIKEGELAAALIVCRIDDVFNVPYALSHRKYLGEHVNNALFYMASCEMLKCEGIKKIFFTVQSLDAPPSVDDFKIRMGLEPIPVRQRVVFHPWLSAFIGKKTLEVVSWFSRKYPGSDIFPKTEGMLEFYVYGKEPLNIQEWPSVLNFLT